MSKVEASVTTAFILMKEPCSPSSSGMTQMYARHLSGRYVLFFSPWKKINVYVGYVVSHLYFSALVS